MFDNKIWHCKAIYVTYSEEKSIAQRFWLFPLQLLPLLLLNHDGCCFCRVTSTVSEFNCLIDSLKKPSYSLLILLWWAAHLLWHQTGATSKSTNRSAINTRSNTRLTSYLTCPDPTVLISVLQESCPHTKAIDEPPWMESGGLICQLFQDFVVISANLRPVHFQIMLTDQWQMEPIIKSCMHWMSKNLRWTNK